MRILGEEILPYLVKDSSPKEKEKFVKLLCQVRSEFIKSPECYAEAKKKSEENDKKKSDDKYFEKLYNHYCKNDLDYYYIDNRNSDNLVKGLEKISAALSEYMSKKVEIVYEK